MMVLLLCGELDSAIGRYHRILSSLVKLLNQYCPELRLEAYIHHTLACDCYRCCCWVDWCIY